MHMFKTDVEPDIEFFDYIKQNDGVKQRNESENAFIGESPYFM